MKRSQQRPRKGETAIIRSSAAEYLTFVAASGDAETSVEMRYEDENIWLTQKMMASLVEAEPCAQRGTPHPSRLCPTV